MTTSEVGFEPRESSLCKSNIVLGQGHTVRVSELPWHNTTFSSRQSLCTHLTSPHQTITTETQQSGFTPGRSTADRILTLNLVSQTRHAYGKSTYAAYVDLKSAFDSQACSMATTTVHWCTTENHQPDGCSLHRVIQLCQSQWGTK